MKYIDRIKLIFQFSKWLIKFLIIKLGTHGGQGKADHSNPILMTVGEDGRVQNL